MKKSPGKWIKTLFFGKKSLKSRSSKGRSQTADGNHHYEVDDGAPLSVRSPVISDPISISTGYTAKKPPPENGVKEDINDSILVMTDGENESLPSEKDSVIEVTVLNDVTSPVASKEDLAATKAQSVFRGYLARRAFRALKGIIRLQALIRGHLVRRQAVATLKCTWGLVTLQSLTRAKKLSQSSDRQDMKVLKSFKRIRSVLKVEASSHVFIRKILSFRITDKPLKIQFHLSNPNSTWAWLERWALSKFWKFASLQTTPRVRPKNSVRRNFGTKKSLSPSVQERSESELEKVKRSLRKVSSAPPPQSFGSAPVVEENGSHDPNAAFENDAPPKEGVMVQDPVVHEEEDVGQVTDPEPVKEEEHTESSGGDDEGTKENNRTLTPDERPICENGRGGKKRSSPVLPSYMAATQSAKAKFCGQDSPRLGSDGSEKNAITRRHSLPSSKNVSPTPRTQRQTPPSNGKIGAKEKAAPVAWRR